MTQRSTGLPAPEQVMELLEAEFTRAGYEIENVAIDSRRVPQQITVVVDGDRPLDLDSIAQLSRVASEKLDAVDTPSAYVLEVTSPGVDRPLTAERHFRRAHGRKVQVELADDDTVTGRLGAIADGMVDLVVRERGDLAVRRLPLAEIRKAVVQVEFSPPDARELELVGDAVWRTGTEAQT